MLQEDLFEKNKQKIIILRMTNLKKHMKEMAWKGCQTGRDQTIPPDT